jgi:DNA-binding transcriptional MerR regulator
MAQGGEQASAGRRVNKSPEAFRTISEVAAELDVPAHVLRFWESKFTQIRPLKRGGRRRYYRPEDVELLRRIRGLLYRDGYTIKGVQKVLRERSSKAVNSVEAEGRETATGGGDGLSADHRTKIEAAVAELDALRKMLKKAAG